VNATGSDYVATHVLSSVTGFFKSPVADGLLKKGFLSKATTTDEMTI